VAVADLKSVTINDKEYKIECFLRGYEILAIVCGIESLASISISCIASQSLQSTLRTVKM